MFSFIIKVFYVSLSLDDVVDNLYGRMSSSEEKIYRSAFARTETIGPILFLRLLRYFGSAKEAWEHPHDFERANIPLAARQHFLHEHASIAPEKERALLDASHVSCVIPTDESFPSCLRELPDAPYILFYRGTLPTLSHAIPAIAVVGTRRCTQYGRQVTQELVTELARAGVIIVSGLAFGIDSEAHRACLKAGGITIAVRGEGIDRGTVGPRSHYQLAEDMISSGGCLLSEYPPRMQGHARHFPQRNRIIAGLSLGTLVTEAPEKSGALITAEYALEYNREVFAVPGSILSQQSRGTNELIKKGAHCVMRAQDIYDQFEYFALTSRDTPAPDTRLNTREEHVMQFLDQPRSIDDLVRISSLDITMINSTLLAMELKGAVQKVGTMIYPKR